MKRYKKFTILFGMLFVIFFLFIPQYAMVYTPGKVTDPPRKKPIRVVDSYTRKPIEGALVTSGNDVAQTDGQGLCSMNIEGNKVAARACGYLRGEEIIPMPQEEKRKPLTPKALYRSIYGVVNRAFQEEGEMKNKQTVTAPQEIKLVPFTPKALYLSFFGIGDRTLRESALNLIQETELNALVIDVKGDRGMVCYKSAIPFTSEVGAQKIITVKDMHGLIKSFKEKGIYTIARIVVFKDNLLALKMPDLAVKTQNGEMWCDREGLAWVDPFQKEVWDYNIHIAMEAAQYGFDEIQFDYVRFPDAKGLQFSMPNIQQNRVAAISGFLMEARKRLSSYNVFVSADIFGYVCWNLNDTSIGQSLEDLPLHLDYLSLMLYPSGFQFGIPGYRIPVTNPHEIVYLSLKRAQERTGLPSVRFRPWLQAFKDYAFDRRSFEGKEIRDQISAVEKFGSDSWMLWNPRNRYSKDGLKSDDALELAFQNLGR